MREVEGLKSEAVIFLCIICFFSLFGFILGFWIQLTENALYQTLSAIIEALSVLLGLIGVFVIFRLEIQDREVRDARDELNVFYPRDRPDFVTERADYTPPEELLKKVKKISRRNPEYFGKDIEHVIKCVKRLQEAIRRKKEIKSLMQLPLFYMMMILSLSLVLLPFSSLTAKSLHSAVRFSYIMCLTGASIYAIIRTLRSLMRLVFE